MIPETHSYSGAKDDLILYFSLNKILFNFQKTSASERRNLYYSLFVSAYFDVLPGDSIARRWCVAMETASDSLRSSAHTRYHGNKDLRPD